MSKSARSSLKLSFWTSGSRLLGLIRDHFQATFFGTGVIATYWEIAYLFPNMLRNLLAEGVLSQSFIPVYSEALRVSEEEARRVAGVIISFLFLMLLLLVALVIAIFPHILPFYIGRSPEESQLLIELSQVLFVFILTASLTAIFAGISHTHFLFSVPAFSPILLNIFFIGGFLYLKPQGWGGDDNARFLAGVVVAGGFAQLMLQMGYVAYRGYWPYLRLRFRDPALRRIFSLMAPAVLGASLFQFNQLMDIAIAGYFIPGEMGAVPALRFAHRLIQLPTGIIGAALATAILPTIAELIRRDSKRESREELAMAISFAAFLTVPAAVGLLMLGPGIINFLFYGGAWDEQSTSATWLALRFYLLGIPFYSINKVLTSSFYAYQDTRTPVKIMFVTVIINLTLNLILVQFLYQGGLALSTSISGVITTGALAFLIQRKMGRLPWRQLGNRLGKQLPLWLVIGAYLLLLNHFGSEWFTTAGRQLGSFFDSGATPRFSGAVQIMVGIGGVFPLYFGLAALLGVEEWQIIRRRRTKK